MNDKILFGIMFIFFILTITIIILIFTLDESSTSTISPSTFLVIAGKDNDGGLMYSVNGQNWNFGVLKNGGSPFQGSRGGENVYYDNNIWVAVGDSSSDNNILTSTNGITWSTAPSISTSGASPFGTGNGNDVFYNDGTWIAVGFDPTNNYNILRSTNDGLSWVQSYMSITGVLPFSNNGFGSGVTYSNSTLKTWVAVGKDNDDNGENILYSNNDGISWIKGNMEGGGSPFNTGNGNGIAFGDDLFVAVGNGNGENGNVLYSSNGIEWNVATMISNGASVFSGGDGRGVVYSSEVDRWVAVGYNGSDGEVVYSSNGHVEFCFYGGWFFFLKP